MSLNTVAFGSPTSSSVSLSDIVGISGVNPETGVRD